MKTTKMIITSAAFAFGIAGAFASQSIGASLFQVDIKEANGSCSKNQTISSLPPNCSTASNPVSCTVSATDTRLIYVATPAGTPGCVTQYKRPI